MRSVILDEAGDWLLDEAGYRIDDEADRPMSQMVAFEVMS